MIIVKKHKKIDNFWGPSNLCMSNLLLTVMIQNDLSISLEFFMIFYIKIWNFLPYFALFNYFLAFMFYALVKMNVFSIQTRCAVTHSDEVIIWECPKTTFSFKTHIEETAQIRQQSNLFFQNRMHIKLSSSWFLLLFSRW